MPDPRPPESTAMSPSSSPPQRRIPAVGRLLGSPAFQDLSRIHGPALVTTLLRRRLDALRQALAAEPQKALPDSATLAAAVAAEARRFTDPLARQAINATGILLHTGLGRAPLGDSARQAVAAAAGYCLLQADADSGRRSQREERVEVLLAQLTGAPAATVVNNNAAAVLLVLNTLAARREVVVSRGELVEIGGAFRMPDVMACSGCRMREIGTTNRTHLRDYQAAIGPETGAIIHVHTSNYRLRGFTSMPDVAALAPLAKNHGLPLIDDLGSGALLPLRDFGLEDEPLVQTSIAAGADAVCFSADKLICGPQAGIICGTPEIIARIRSNPFARMFRVCKLTLAALEATLLHFVNGDAVSALPFYRMLTRPLEDVERAAQALAASLAHLPGLDRVIADDHSQIGSGSLPDVGIPTRVLRLRGCEAKAVARRARAGAPALFTRVHDGALVVDLRTVDPQEEGLMASLLIAALDGAGHA